MEQVSIKNLPAVCENSLASEVNQINNIAVTNFTKPCRIKNGLVNGVVESRMEEKHSPSKTHNLKENSSLNDNFNQISPLQHDLHSNDTLEACDMVKMKHSETECTCSKRCTEVLNSEPKEKLVAENCMTNISKEFNKNLIVDMHKLNLQNANSNCETMVTGEVLQDIEGNSEEITYEQYESELQMPLIMKIIQKDLSEPYSIYTYRYFIHNWPKLCFLAMCGEKCVGAIVCKLDYHRKSTKRGYIAMLAVDQHYRKKKIGSTLVRRAIREMIAGNADEVVLETEVTNKPALRLYELLGFVRDKRLFRYYLNGVDALRLKLWLR